jgi:Fe-S cluster assembly protein SufD
MNRRLPDVKDSYLSQFKALSGNGAEGMPGWLQAIRGAAMEQFGATGFPGSGDERWRFTNMRRLTEATFSLAGADTEMVTREDIDRHVLVSSADQCLVFVNGRFAADLSSLGGLPEGVVATSIGTATRSDLKSAERHLTKYARPGDNPFTALSTAFMIDGGLLFIPPNVVLDNPIQLLFLSVATRTPSVSHPRCLIVAEGGSTASVVEVYAGHGTGEYWTNSVTEVVVGENARLETYRIQQESEQAHHTATTQSYQARAGVFGLTTVELGALLSRHDINAVLDGEGAECHLYGLSQLRGRQHVDHHTTIEHAKPHCNSWEYFNGIYDNRSRGVFTGRIVVRPDAQQTDSKQTNNSLLLSDTARADSQPQLEIYADDVKCTHGATLGPIDERALFYFRSRGIEAETARHLLTYGFGVEILTKIGIAELRQRLDDILHSRLEEGAKRRRRKR